MIREVLLPLLRARFSGRGLREGAPPQPLATFPAADPEVGDLRIWDGAEEATVEVGDLIHAHFNPYDAGVSPDELALRVSEEVLGFLDDLVSEVAFTSASGIPGHPASSRTLHPVGALEFLPA